jgi:3'(2'), 5'-bisphosphate nucleotidase
MPALPLSREKKIALRAAGSAAMVCMKVLSTIDSQSTISKTDRTPVTVADYGSQAVACRILKEAFASDPIVAEENSEALGREENALLLSRVRDAARIVFPDAAADAVRRWIDMGTKEIAPRYWCLDPIDGTKGFLRKDQYAIALALVIDGTVRLGVLVCPNLPEDLTRPEGARGVVFLATQGGGAFQTPLGGSHMRPIRVVSQYRNRTIRFCESFESAHSDHELQEQIGKQLGITEPAIQMDSQAKYGIVARGDSAIYLRLPSPKTPDYREKVWDHAAGAILVEEAGGKVTDALGRPLDFGVEYRLMKNEGVIATNGALHDKVISALRDRREAMS